MHGVRRADSRLRSAGALAALWIAGCATTGGDRQAVRAAWPAAPPQGDAVVMLADLAPGQPLVAFGRRSDHLPPPAAARFRDAIVGEARRRGLDRVRAALPPPFEAAAPGPGAAPARADGADWGGNVVTTTRAPPPPRPAPPRDVSWLEITSLDLDQAALAEGPGATHLLLDVTARRTDGAARPGDPPATAEVRVLLVDREPIAALDAPPGEASAGAAEAVDAATARLLDRAAGRLASLLVPAPQTAAPAPGPGPAQGEGRPAPIEVIHAARHLGTSTARAERSRAVARDAGRAADSLAAGGLVCGPLGPVCAGILALVGAGAVGLAGMAGVAAVPVDGPTYATLPPEDVRAALTEEVRRLAEPLSLAVAVERAAREASADAGMADPRLQVGRVEVRLTGDEGSGFPTRVALVVTVAPQAGRGAPDVLRLETPDALPLLAWLDDGGALLRLVLERAARAAGADAVARHRRGAPAGAGPAATR